MTPAESSEKILARLLWEQRQGGEEQPHPEGLGSALYRLIAEARGVWPDIDLGDEDFVRYIAKRLGPEPEEALERLHVSDLYLSCACVGGDPVAIAALERFYLPAVRASSLRAGFAPALIEEVEQALRARLLVGDDKQPPKLSQYTGRGQLKNWLRVASVRDALEALRQAKREVPLSRTDWPRSERRLNESEPEPELEFLKSAYRDDFNAAFAESARALSARERTLLRYHFLDRITLDRLGAMYRVHRVSVARWIARARKRLLAGTREHLGARLGLQDSELDSLIRLLRSRLDVTLSRVLESS